MKARLIWQAVKTTFSEWRRDKAQRLSAAIAFYTILSLSPLLVIVVALAGRVFGDDAVRGEIVRQFDTLIGHGAATQIETMIASANDPKENLVATVLGVAMLLLGAMGIFGQIKDALDTIWDARPKKHKGIRGFVRNYVLSLGMVLGSAFLLLVSLVVSAGVSAITRWAGALIPSTTGSVLRILDLGVSLGVITLLFAMIYRVLPEVRISWRDVWVGALVTAILFNIGKFFIGLYLGRSTFASVFGAAGSLVVILVWIYYSASVFLLGAEFTEVYSRFWGSRAPRAAGAPADVADRSVQGSAG